MLEPRQSVRCAARSAALLVSLLVAACSSDGPTGARTDGLVSAVLEGPADVSAVVIDFTSVSHIDVEGGDVFTSATDDGIRAVIVLHAPGPVRMLLTPVSEGVKPTATPVDVSDGAYQLADPAVYDVVVGS